MQDPTSTKAPGRAPRPIPYPVDKPTAPGALSNGAKMPAHAFAFSVLVTPQKIRAGTSGPSTPIYFPCCACHDPEPVIVACITDAAGRPAVRPSKDKRTRLERHDLAYYCLTCAVRAAEPYPAQDRRRILDALPALTHYADHGFGAECGRANVASSEDRGAVSCPWCLDLLAARV